MLYNKVFDNNLYFILYKIWRKYTYFKSRVAAVRYGFYKQVIFLAPTTIYFIILSAFNLRYFLIM